MSKAQLLGPIIKKLAIFAAGALAALFITKTWNQNFKKEEIHETQEHPVNQSVVSYEEDDRDYDVIEEIMLCPITGTIMKHPWIITECGHSFERKEIVKWLRKQSKCPVCNIKAEEKRLRPNYQLKQVIRAYQNKRKEKQQEYFNSNS